MNKAEKFKEIFGVEPNMQACITPECIGCPANDPYGCTGSYKWWESEYKEPEKTDAAQDSSKDTKEQNQLNVLESRFNKLISCLYPNTLGAHEVKWITEDTTENFSVNIKEDEE